MPLGGGSINALIAIFCNKAHDVVLALEESMIMGDDNFLISMNE